MPEPKERLQTHSLRTVPAKDGTSVLEKLVTLLLPNLEDEPTKRRKEKAEIPRVGKEGKVKTRLTEIKIPKGLKKEAAGAVAELNQNIFWVLQDKPDLIAHPEVLPILLSIADKPVGKLTKADIPRLLRVNRELRRLRERPAKPVDVSALQERIYKKIMDLEPTSQQLVEAEQDLPEQTPEERREILQQVQRQQAPLVFQQPAASVKDLPDEVLQIKAEIEGKINDRHYDINPQQFVTARGQLDVRQYQHALRDRIDELNEDYHRLSKAKEIIPPQEVLPNMKHYQQAVDRLWGNFKAIEEHQDRLAEKLADLMAQHLDTMRDRPLDANIKTVEQFLYRQRGEQPGALARLLRLNPKIEYKLLRDRKSLHRLFLQIMEPVLSERDTPSHESLDLYRRADLVTFMNLVSRMDKIHLRRREKLGEMWKNYYINLKDSLIQSHDIDFWAAHPRVEARQFAESCALYRNEYLGPLLSNPLVGVAYRAYEIALLAIRDSHGGYIPPSLIGWHGVKMERYWDKLAENIFRKMLFQGVVYDVERDKKTGLPIIENGVIRRRATPIRWENEDERLDDLEIMEALTLGKGFGMANMQLLRIFANSRGPGSEHAVLGMKAGFHSIPYEQIVVKMKPHVHLFTKWKFGHQFYWHFFNQMLPQPIPKNILEQRVHHLNDPKKAYLMFREGRVEDIERIFGKGAKRIMDIDNLTSISSLGPWSGIWRVLDSTIGWTDLQREKLGGMLNLLIAKKGIFAEEKVQDVFAANGGEPLNKLGGYRLEFAKMLEDAGEIRLQQVDEYEIPDDWDKFNRLWRARGQGHYPGWGRYENELGRQMKKEPNKKRVEALKKAYMAKTWIKMAEQNPLFISRLLKVGRDVHGRIGGPGEITLRDKLLEEILEIELDRDVISLRTPTDEQVEYMETVTNLEADIATIRERMMREGKGYAEYGDEGFDRLVDETIKQMVGEDKIPVEKRREWVKKYWRRTREVLLGSWQAQATQQWLESIGLTYKKDPNGKPIEIIYNWDKIEAVPDLFKRGELPIKGAFLTGELLARDFEYTEALDDVLWYEMDLLNLGSRQFGRAGGDYLSHSTGIDRMTKFIHEELGFKFDIETFVKAHKEIQLAFSGDDVAWGWKGAYLWALATGRMFKKPWFYAKTGVVGRVADIFTASSQMQQLAEFHTLADAADANKLMQFVDALHNASVLPARTHPLIPEGDPLNFVIGNIPQLRRELGATRSAAIFEILMMLATLAPLLTVGMAAWQGVTQKEEEKK